VPAKTFEKKLGGRARQIFVGDIIPAKTFVGDIIRGGINFVVISKLQKKLGGRGGTADTQRAGRCGRKPVRVQISPSAL